MEGGENDEGSVFRIVKNGIGHNFKPFWSYEAIYNGEKFLIAEVDDVMHNTLGCLIGYGLYSIVRIGYEKIR